MSRVFALTLFLVFSLAALAVPVRAEALVFAAASLKGTMEDLARDWRAKGGSGAVKFVYGGTSALAKQIEEGAPASVFVSADVAWMDNVEARNLLKVGSRFDLAGNTLVLIGKAGEAALASAAEIPQRLDGRKFATADITSVPAGKYAKAALGSLGFFDRIAPDLVQTENVRAAMELVALGEAGLGVVYATDARAEPRVSVLLTFAGSTHPPIIYPAAEIAAQANADSASFMAYLRSVNAQDILRKRGFLVHGT